MQTPHGIFMEGPNIISLKTKTAAAKVKAKNEWKLPPFTWRKWVKFGYNLDGLTSIWSMTVFVLSNVPSQIILLLLYLL